ncbi:MAG: hypothetical protein HOP29_19235 [Phycisphaerales bacterium]|nr:hypothetical protein [Phycisphaerales bacterium]
MSRHRGRELPAVLKEEGRCIRCGYKISNTGVNVCPECGNAVIDGLKQE